MFFRKKSRLKNYDYASDGWYFVTICFHERENMFGNVIGAGFASAQNNIKLSIIGKIVYDQWNDIPNHNDHIGLDKFVIMPNHIHGILIVSKRADARPAPTN